jgi:hypothetical protein
VNRTELRHRLLRAIADAEPGTYYHVPGYAGVDPSWRSRQQRLSVGEPRALREFDQNNFLTRGTPESASIYSRRQLVLSNSGARLLAEWDEKYGPVTP